MNLFNRIPKSPCYLCGRMVKIPDGSPRHPDSVFICRDCDAKLSNIRTQGTAMTKAELTELAEQLLSLPVSDFKYVIDLISDHLQTIYELQNGTMEGC